MAFTGTSLLSLPIITTGTESGAWGNITNNGLTQYLDTSIAGALSITSSITLANTSGDATGTNLTSTTAQYRTLVVPASGPSANIVITAPSSNRTYHVVNRNATYTVQIRAGTNSGVTLGVNQSATVTYNSTSTDYELVGTSVPILNVDNLRLDGNTISSTNTNGTITIAPNGTGDVVAQVNATNVFSVSSTFGFKNRIINGAMMIDQRNAGASLTIPNGTTYTLDRWVAYTTQASKISVQQNAGSVTPPAGYKNYLGVTSLSAYSLVSSDYFVITQPIEGLNVADFAWGTASAAAIAVSFWVRASITGTYNIRVNNSDGSRNYLATYTVNAANTWEQKTITISGDTSGTWLTTNSLGLSLQFSLGAGSTYQGAAGSWGNTTVIATSGSNSVVGTSGATFYITGVQLEKGSTATSFDYRPYGTELALCQRYYWKSFNQSVAPAQNVGSSDGALQSFGPATNVSFTAFQQLPVTMRAAPTVTTFSPDNASTDWSDQAGVRPTASVLNVGTNAFAVRGTTSVLAGGSYSIHATANAEL